MPFPSSLNIFLERKYGVQYSPLLSLQPISVYVWAAWSTSPVYISILAPDSHD